MSCDLSEKKINFLELLCPTVAVGIAYEKDGAEPHVEHDEVREDGVHQRFRKSRSNVRVRFVYDFGSRSMRKFSKHRTQTFITSPKIRAHAL